MKVSIITVCLNSEDTILHTLNSVLSQSYKNIEHIIVDGGSQDKTIGYIKKYKFRNKKVIFKNKCSLYNSINIGIKNSTGKIITILHSDDIFNSTNTIEKVIGKIQKSNKKIFFGDVVYYRNSFKNIIRYYKSSTFERKQMLYGFMPPHTGSYYNREIFEQQGYYKNFKIAGDFEHLLRILYKKSIQFEHLNLITTRMKSGGLSSKNFNSYITINKEIIKSFKINFIKINKLFIFFRIPSKIMQFIIFDKKNINSTFRHKETLFFKKYYEDTIKLLLNLKKLDFKKNFILSALNLAFLGSYSKGLIKTHKNMINWPDGIFSKIYGKNIKKIPGREVISEMSLPKSINRIIVVGNLSLKGKEYLQKKFKKKIVNLHLPFGHIDKIKKKSNFKFFNSDIVFITLPTPKQEQIAFHLSEINKHFKIVCIGGSIGIVSGDEKPVPKSLINFEFFWRLRYETKRRIFRLLETLYFYLFDVFFSKKLKNLKIKYLK